MHQIKCRAYKHKYQRTLQTVYIEQLRNHHHQSQINMHTDMHAHQNTNDVYAVLFSNIIGGSNNKHNILMYARPHALFCHRQTTIIGTHIFLCISTNIPKMHLMNCCWRRLKLFFAIVVFAATADADVAWLFLFFCLDFLPCSASMSWSCAQNWKFNWTELNWTNGWWFCAAVVNVVVTLTVSHECANWFKSIFNKCWISNE